MAEPWVFTNLAQMLERGAAGEAPLRISPPNVLPTYVGAMAGGGRLQPVCFFLFIVARTIARTFAEPYNTSSGSNNTRGSTGSVLH